QWGGGGERCRGGVVDGGGHMDVGQGDRGGVGYALRPFGESITQFMACWGVNPSPVGFNLFLRCPSSHPDDDRAGEDGIGEVAEASERDGAVGGDFLGLNLLALDDAATSDGALAMSGVEEATDFLVIAFRLGSED